MKEVKMKVERKPRVGIILFITMLTFVHFFMYASNKKWDTFVKAFSWNMGNEHKKADTVIIFSQIRSGSSFVGDFFNKRMNVSYFFEPVWDVTREHMGDAVTVIEELSNCRFDKLASIYTESLDGKGMWARWYKLLK